jgi:hypothetical protein
MQWILVKSGKRYWSKSEIPILRIGGSQHLEWKIGTSSDTDIRRLEETKRRV